MIDPPVASAELDFGESTCALSPEVLKKLAARMEKRERPAQYDTTAPYGLADYLVSQGAPVFVSKPADEISHGEHIQGVDFGFPGGWQDTVAGAKNVMLGNVKRFYNAGDKLRDRALRHGVHVVTGVQFDVIDVDTQNGGEESFRKLEGLGVLPPVYGRYKTPSGGLHLFVPRSGFRTRHKIEGFPGIDFQMGSDEEDVSSGNNRYGRANVFIYPTMKRRKLGVDAEGNKQYSEDLSGYQVEIPIDVPALRAGVEDPRMEAWVGWLAENGATIAPSVGRAVAPVWNGAPHDAREKKFLDGCLKKAVENVRSAAKGDSNRAFVSACLWMGGLIAGAGLDQGRVEAELRRAGEARRVEKVEYYLQRSLADGMRQPQGVPPSDPDWKNKVPREELSPELKAQLDGDDYVDQQDQINDEWLTRLNQNQSGR